VNAGILGKLALSDTGHCSSCCDLLAGYCH
jgi:hypothetical protein